ncbi:uncharacterized protein LOC120288167 [Eucalyptus grandis]|uniref:uncharacterized protein LOC120288167 n=1 Tax=Eucalyptus grandis TaxID=71139 RepID=UPI00192E9D16|nr:uncharacterized protein LOC120288167 [Eucalyptus grandis]
MRSATRSGSPISERQRKLEDRHGILRIQENISFLERPQSEGMPRYLPYLLRIGTLNSCARFCCNEIGQYLLKNTPDLFLLMSWPVATQYWFRRLARLWHSDRVALRKNTESSAKKR